MEPLGQYPDPTHVVAHLSDPHLLAGSLQYDAVDTVARLEAALERLGRVPTPPQALVFTGDLADKGEPAAYRTSELAPDQRLLSGVDAHQSFTLLHLYDDRVVHSVVPATDAVEVSGYGLEMLEPFRSLTPEQCFDMVSRKDSPLNAPLD